MDIAQFVERSEGQWRSMRSGHSLAFQQFEEVLSAISITAVAADDPGVTALLQQHQLESQTPAAPFAMEWKAESDWEPDDPNDVAAGSCLLVPIPTGETTGKLLRSVGYAEAERLCCHRLEWEQSCMTRMTPHWDHQVPNRFRRPRSFETVPKPLILHSGSTIESSR